MSTKQDIYAAGSENRPPMLNKKNYVPWSSRLLRYAKSRPNGKLIYYSIINDDDNSLRKELKQVEADDQAIQTILLGSDIRIQEKKAKLFNEWERFTSTDGESIESYYNLFSKLMNDFKRNKHFPEKIASNLKFLNNLQPEWSRHVTIYNQKEVDDLRAEQLAKTHDPLALMANSNNPFSYQMFHQDQPSPSTYMQQLQPINNNYNPQPSFNQNYIQQPMLNPKNITDPTTAMNMALVLMIAQPGMNMGQDRQMQMVRGNGGNQFRQYAGKNVRNQNGYNAVQNVGNQVVKNAVHNPAARAEGNAIRNKGNQIRCYNCRGLGHLARNCTVRPMRRDAAYLQTQLDKGGGEGGCGGLWCGGSEGDDGDVGREVGGGHDGVAIAKAVVVRWLWWRGVAVGGAQWRLEGMVMWWWRGGSGCEGNVGGSASAGIGGFSGDGSSGVAWGGDDGDDNKGGVMVGCDGEAAGGGGGAWRRVDMGIG
ncbi:integrase, catalytic region, zinc finger, CCHC-type containing protein [Tanacetum coccineum]